MGTDPGGVGGTMDGIRALHEDHGEFIKSETKKKNIGKLRKTF